MFKLLSSNESTAIPNTALWLVQTYHAGWKYVLSLLHNSIHIVNFVILQLLQKYLLMEWGCGWRGFLFSIFGFFNATSCEVFVIMYNVQCWSPVPECSVPSWDMCFMEMFTQSVNNRAAAPSPAAAPLKTSAWKSSIRRFVITEKAPTRAFSWLKAATTAFTFKTLC